jgi:hypothetical protein
MLLVDPSVAHDFRGDEEQKPQRQDRGQGHYPANRVKFGAARCRGYLLPAQELDDLFFGNRTLTQQPPAAVDG